MRHSPKNIYYLVAVGLDQILYKNVDKNKHLNEKNIAI